MVTKRIIFSAIAISATVALAGCSAAPATVSMSRVELYGSLEELTQASAVVAVVEVSEQSVSRDIDAETEFTLSTVIVQDIVSTDRELTESSELIVRQLGGSEQPAPTPLLTVGDTYLLYLTASGLEAPLDTQFYVTGANAGVYALPATAPNARSVPGAEAFVQVDAEHGERLPSEITLDEAVGATD